MTVLHAKIKTINLFGTLTETIIHIDHSPLCELIKPIDILLHMYVCTRTYLALRYAAYDSIASKSLPASTASYIEEEEEEKKERKKKKKLAGELSR